MCFRPKARRGGGAGAIGGGAGAARRTKSKRWQLVGFLFSYNSVFNCRCVICHFSTRQGRRISILEDQLTLFQQQPGQIMSATSLFAVPTPSFRILIPSYGPVSAPPLTQLLCRTVGRYQVYREQLAIVRAYV